MSKVKIIAITIFLILLQSTSCEKELYDLDVNLMVNKTTFYPHDSIDLYITAFVTGGIKPYTYHWINPDSIDGPGPHLLHPNNNETYILEVTDSINKIAKGSLQIDVDEILQDSTNYFHLPLFMDDLIGTYNCVEKNGWWEPGWEGSTATNYNVKLTVSKHLFNLVHISTKRIGKLTFVVKDNMRLEYGDGDGRYFPNDSIYVHVFTKYSDTKYYGKKME